MNPSRRTFLVVSWSLPPLAALAAPEPPDTVFLLIGQSNMAGRATIEPEDAAEIPGASLWNIGAGTWEPAKAPFNRYSPHHKGLAMQRLNPGPSFARAWLAAHPGRRVGFVCAVRGGTSIEQWEKGRREPWPLYDTAVAATRAALAAAPGARLGGILWHQGEADCAEPAAYPARLKQLVAWLRADFGDPGLPFVFGQIGAWNPDYAAFNAMILRQPSQLPHTACVSADGLTNMDIAHFDTPSQRELGRRYFRAWQGLAAAGGPAGGGK